MLQELFHLKKSLTAKLNWFIIFVIFLVLSVTATIVWIRKNIEKERLIADKEKELEAELRNRIELFARFATTEVDKTYDTYYNYTAGSEGLSPEETFTKYFVDKMYEKLDANVDIVYAILYDVTGRVLFKYDELINGKKMPHEEVKNDPDLLARIQSDQPTIRGIGNCDTCKIEYVDRDGIPHRVLDVTYPIITTAGHFRTARYLVSYRNLKKSVARTEEQLTQMTYQSIIWVLSFILGLGILSVIISVILGQQITKPIKQLVKEATTIADGNLDHEVELHAEDEVGVLADKFEEMRISLKQKIKEIAKKAMGLEGTLEIFSFPDLINFICMGQMTGSLSIEGPTQSGLIYFVTGNITHAEVGGLEGDDAVYSFFSWRKGTFSFQNGARTEKETVKSHWQHLLMEGARQTDELDVIKRQIPSPYCILQTVPQQSEAQKEIKLTPNELKMIVLIQQERVVKNILKKSGLSELETYQLLYRLVSSGLVEVKS